MKQFLLIVGLLLIAGCSPGPADRGGDVVRTMAGDTLVVRTVRGAVWPATAEWRPVLDIGELDGPEETAFGQLVSIAVLPDGRILAVDRQVPTIRVFAADGSYLGSWGRRGSGPGELEAPDAGLAVLSDGRVVVRDPGNARLQLFLPDGTPSDTWPVITGQFINRRAFGVSGGALLNPDVINPNDPLPEWRLGLVRIDAGGQVLDTLAIPDPGTQAHRFSTRAGGNTAEMALPFAATHHWAWHPDGFIVHGRGDRFALTLDRDPDPLRIEREVMPTPVSAEERDQEEQRVLNGMRWLDPTWRWDGPSIPWTKPVLSGVVTGADGRIWVLRDGQSYEVDDPDYDPTEPFATEIRWRQERVADAFEVSGTFLGTVTMPRELDSGVPPILRGDTLWAVVRDELGVQRVRRFELGFRGGE